VTAGVKPKRLRAQHLAMTRDGWRNKSLPSYCLGFAGLVFAALFFNAYFERRIEVNC